MKAFLRILTLIGVVLMVSACANGGRAAGGSAIPLLDESEMTHLFYTNPRGITNIGDPFVLLASDGYYYMYATSWDMGYIGWRSADMVNWTRLGPVFNAFRDPNQWADSHFWAPEVVEHGGRFYMYYTARHRETASLRIGVAVSDSPAGPFLDAIGAPIMEFGYAVIDAHVFQDTAGVFWLYYSRDCSEHVVNGVNESHIYVIRLGDDMISVVGEPIWLMGPTQPWETPGGGWRWNEGAWVMFHDGLYYLMYSANYFASKAYSVGFATSESPTGPFVKYENNPILFAAPMWTHVSGPGHHSVTHSRDGREMFAVYHTHTSVTHPSGDRQVQIDRMGFRADGSIFINGPSATLMPVPSTDDFRNLAAYATVTTNCGGENVPFLTDGAIGFSRRNAHHDWVSAAMGPVVVEMAFDEPVYVQAMQVFPGAEEGRLIGHIDIVFDGADYIEGLTLPSLPGGGATAAFAERQVSHIQITVHPAEGASEPIRLSEIFVLGRK